MGNNLNTKKENKLKRLFSRFAEKIDQKLKEKTEKCPSCCGGGKDKGNSCCS